jgi:hypothetical protein
VPHTVNFQEPCALARPAPAPQTISRRRVIAELRNEANFTGIRKLRNEPKSPWNLNKMKPVSGHSETENKPIVLPENHAPAAPFHLGQTGPIIAIHTVVVLIWLWADRPEDRVLNLPVQEALC